jgi:uracil-DNA glycosylase family 4
MDELATLSADLRAWLSWQEMLGASALPRESVPKMPPVEIPAAVPVRSAPVTRQPSPPPNNRVVAPPAPTPVSPAEPAAPKAVLKSRPAVTEKWKVLMEGPTTHQVEGPTDARLMIVRGSGSSPEAESMLSRMLENVVGLSRNQVCVVDLIRDTRTPADIGQGFRSSLADLKPTLMLVMGTFAVRALYGDEHAVADVRGAWTELSYPGGVVTMRVTHHPEAILVLAARGQASPKREAFEDLKALGQRLT